MESKISVKNDQFNLITKISLSGEREELISTKGIK